MKNYFLFIIILIIFSCSKEKSIVTPDKNVECRTISIIYGTSYRYEFTYDAKNELITARKVSPFLEKSYKIGYDNNGRAISMVETQIDSTEYKIFGVRKYTIPYMIEYGTGKLPLTYYMYDAPDVRHVLRYNTQGQLLRDTYSFNKTDSIYYRYEYNPSGNRIASFAYEPVKRIEWKQVSSVTFDTSKNSYANLGLIGYLMNFDVYSSNNVISGNTHYIDGSEYQSYNYSYSYSKDNLPVKGTYKLTEKGNILYNLEGSYQYNCP
ncbi:hypothetical protein J2I47_14700 [Fibrella sp. HMF5335]|uniref:Uncharacterized protein n=1 Tax=Fibrella rubiginis TaxID=2817060 RepID=A0A939GJA9_9BACT|nr:hypothetical protein [Fibrella rubiginis]MBO0937806.1 hypothetical protein [Fibrella rubiginis]